ncbi:hypothetical protein EMCG_07621 [[Emmonsia] crescens]|uniref:RING-type E3 ubiquitin transferase n=1 Tax=[Emmonsia] crescens TaxID=73230 RepID=A0A0G2I7T5_9EURO|nr:hypothetical protein EMCG_07621 [Emmonsia crescens UAMH 3008]
MHILPSSLVEMMIPALLSICACTLLSAPAQAQVSRPSNDMADLFLPAPDMNYQLHTRQFSLPPTNLAPLTTDLKRMFRDGFESDFNITGILVIIGANNASTTSGDDIVLISCDESAYSGESKVDDTLRLAITAPSSPSAIILYTTEFAHCNYTPEVLSWPQYRNIFTVTNPLAAREILAGIHSDEKSLGNTNIVPDMSIAPFRAGEEGGQRNNAMIILYSITGIITALFLTVIVTGAIRAHLNPERYGPRNAVGRPRQSRAKGIARAMLETLPIIKFGDPENGKPPTAKPDVELASTYGDTEHDRSRSDPRVAGVITPETRQLEQHQQQQPQPEEQQQQQQVAQTVAAPSASHIDANKEQQQDEGVIGPASPEPQTVSPDQTTDASALGCPICTDDFIKGQDVRLLPCQHKFHPECVDPWLINVSGTCPLW